MSFGGWIIMLLSVGGTTAFFVWMVVRVLSIPGETDKVHGFDRHTPDEDRDQQ